MGKPNLEQLKLRVASQVGVNLNQNYNGDITTKQAGLIGGNMVRALITHAEQNLSTTNPTTTVYPSTFTNQSWNEYLQ